jgi:hypothetical protein
MEHHEYIKEKMAFKRNRSLKFTNKSSDRILESMKDRKPLYHIPVQSIVQDPPVITNKKKDITPLSGKHLFLTHL